MEKVKIVMACAEDARLVITTEIEFLQEPGKVFAILKKIIKFGACDERVEEMFIEDRETAAKIAAAFIEQSTKI